MRALIIGLFSLALAILPASMGRAHDIAIDFSQARAVLTAIADPQLSPARARQIAEMPASQAVIAKVRSLPGGQDVTVDSYVEELTAAAQGRDLERRTLFQFSNLARNREGVLAALEDFETHIDERREWIASRIAEFQPETDAPLQLSGYVIAGGNATGFLGSLTDFYLNIAHFANDPEPVQLIFAHELYHAVQAAAAIQSGVDLGQVRFNPETLAAQDTVEGRNAYLTERFLFNLMAEGIAMYVGDPMLATGDGRYAVRDRERVELQQGRMDRLAIQLDMSLVAITAENGVSYDQAYALGFFGPDQPLYYLGYEMAKAIAEEQGGARLGALAIGGGCDFVQAYLPIAAADSERPQLGPHTIRYVADYCG